MRGTAQINTPNPSPNYQSIFLRQFVTLEQLQGITMKLSRHQLGLLILEKLKKQLYPHVQQQQFMNCVKNDAIHVMCNLLYDLIIECEKMSEQIINPIIEQKYRHQRQSDEYKRQLQDYIQQSQVLKSMVDNLQQEKNEILSRYNNELAQFQRSKQDVEHQIEQKLIIKHEIDKISQNVQIIFDENYNLKQQLQACQNQILLLNASKQYMTKDNQDLKQNCDNFYQKYLTLSEQCRTLRHENELLKHNLQEKQEFISTFINEYNQSQIFNQDYKYYINHHRTPKDHDELNQYHFNQYDNKSLNSSRSVKSISKNTSLKVFDKDIEQEMEEKIGGAGGNATAEKVIPKVFIHKNCITDEKLKNKLLIPNSKNKNSNVNNKNDKCNEKKKEWRYFFNKKDNISNNNTIIRAVSSNNIRKLQEPMTPASDHSSKIMQDALRKKLNQKIQKIAQLQLKNARLIESLIQQRQLKTNLQGEYQIMVEQLKNQIDYHKNEYSQLYKNNLMVNLDNEQHLQQIQALEKYVIQLKESHRQYCKELKSKCKAYLIQKLDEAQEICSKHRSSNNPHQISIQNSFELVSSQVKQKSNNDQISIEKSFQMNPSPIQKKNDISAKVLYEQLKNIESYSSGELKYSNELQKIEDKIKQQMLIEQQNLQANSNMTFSIKFSNLNQLPNYEIYARDNYEVQSDSNFSDARDQDRTIYNQYGKNRGHFTDRNMASKNAMFLDFRPVAPYKKTQLQLYSSLVSQHIAGFEIQYNLQSIKCFEIEVPPLVKQLRIVQMVDYTYQPMQKFVSLQIYKGHEHIYVPIINPNNLTFCSLSLSVICIPQQIRPKLLKHYSNLFSIIDHSDKQNEQMNNRELELFSFEEVYPKIQDANQQRFHGQIIKNQQQMLKINIIDIIQSQKLPTQQKLSLQISIIPEASNQSNSISQQTSIIYHQQHPKILTNDNKIMKQVQKYNKIYSSNAIIEGHIQELFLKNIRDNINVYPSNIKSQNNVNKYGLQNKQNMRSVNPQSKQLINKPPLQEVHVSDWFSQEETKAIHNANHQAQHHDHIPQQVITAMPLQQLSTLKSYLSKHKISLRYHETIQYPFIKPKSIEQKLYLMNLGVQFVLITQNKIISLLNGTFLQTNKQYYIDDKNFKFGNSEVIIRSDQYLVINRKNKKNLLSGNMIDGSWFINYCISLDVINNIKQ